MGSPLTAAVTIKLTVKCLPLRNNAARLCLCHSHTMEKSLPCSSRASDFALHALLFAQISQNPAVPNRILGGLFFLKPRNKKGTALKGLL